MKPSLAGLRFAAERSRGRRHAEPPHPYRDGFQRDRDRIIHARAFRRLEDKTQVFTSALSDHFRNRLTHTIEVAQIARTAAAALELNEELTEALALVHDIGHPPFAHAGEAELNRQMARYGGSFDHNLHALRIVEVLEQRYADFPGLNLTFEVREGTAKHSRDFEPGEFPELDEYLPGLRPSAEAQLIDLADEVAYSTADLDDAHDGGLFEIEEIGAEVPAFGRLLSAARKRHASSPERVLFAEALRGLIDLLVSGLIEGTREAALAGGLEHADDVPRHPVRIARLTPDAETACTALKNFLHGRVYFSGDLLRERTRAAAMVAALFEHFMEHPGSLPPAYASQASLEKPHRVVCDYIAGMTDGYLGREFQRVFQMGELPTHEMR
ncbi:MAG: dNTP triphosphohydrolase [Bryobacterales bacterium]|nr:dNTP triphosphohydrolase [Bryobacterales bacterium]